MVQGQTDRRRFDVYAGGLSGAYRPAYDDRSAHAGRYPYADRPPPPPPPPRENWLGWVAFLLGVAVISAAAGYTLNRATSDPPVASPAPATGTPQPGATNAAGAGAPAAGAPSSPGPAAGPTAEQVAIMLANQGLPLRTTVVYTAQNDPDGLLGRPGGYASRLAFADSRIGTDEIAGAAPDAIERGGAIEVFGDSGSARSRGATLHGPGGGDAAPEYTYVRGPVVLRLSLILPETMAAGYQTALARIAGAS